MREAAETPAVAPRASRPTGCWRGASPVRLEAWGIRVDDSAGRPFAKTPPGAFLDLVISAAADEASRRPTIMALFKHPLTRLGLEAFDARRAARALETHRRSATLYLGHGLDGVEAAFREARAGAQDVDAEQRRHRRRNAACGPSDWQRRAGDSSSGCGLRSRRCVALFDAPAHDAARGGACAHGGCGGRCAFAGRLDEAGRRPAVARRSRRTAAQLSPASSTSSCPKPISRRLTTPISIAASHRTENVRPRGPVHPRLSIWGPFEARLQQTDIVILGSLNDGTWPKSSGPGAVAQPADARGAWVCRRLKRRSGTRRTISRRCSLRPK